MTYKANYDTVSESGNFEPLPEGNYTVKIEKIQETTTKKSGLPLIKIRYKVIDEGKFKNRILFDQITLFEGDAPGAGITKHFLHVIGQPYQGDFEIDPGAWVDAELQVKIVIDKQYDSNKVKSHSEGGIPF